jgi:hypothetical protein
MACRGSLTVHTAGRFNQSRQICTALHQLAIDAGFCPLGTCPLRHYRHPLGMTWSTSSRSSLSDSRYLALRNQAGIPLAQLPGD